MGEDDVEARTAEVVGEVSRLRREMLAWQRAVDDEWQSRVEQNQLGQALHTELAEARLEVRRARTECEAALAEVRKAHHERDAALAEVAKVRASRSFRVAHAAARAAARVRRLGRRLVGKA